MFRSSAELKALYRAERRVKKSGLGRIIATRVLNEETARDHKITVIIGAPRRAEIDHWLCPYLIDGIVESGIQYGYGVDALQSLLIALQAIRLDLERTGRRFIWFGDSPGIPRQVPTDYGRQFEQRVERAIQRESERVWRLRLQARKAEIASAEARLRVLKTAGSRRKEPAGKADIETEVVNRENQLRAMKKTTAEWETDLKKWRPEHNQEPRKTGRHPKK
jgi:hypothetical protein